MAKRKNDDEEDVSLFPFLSILACIIGTLTLMITALAIGQMDTDSVADAEEYEELVKESKTVVAQSNALKDQIREAAKRSSGKAQEFVKQQTALAILEQQLKEFEEKEKDRPEVLPTKIAIDFDLKLKQLGAEQKQLAEKIQRLQNEVDQLDQAKEAVVQVKPGGSGVDFIPTFVECSKDGLVVYFDDADPHRVTYGNIKSDVKFLKLLDDVAADETRTVTFLLRQDGVGTYYAARGIARTRYAKNGKLPIMGKGKIDLSLFK